MWSGHTLFWIFAAAGIASRPAAIVEYQHHLEEISRASSAKILGIEIGLRTPDPVGGFGPTVGSTSTQVDHRYLRTERGSPSLDVENTMLVSYRYPAHTESSNQGGEGVSRRGLSVWPYFDNDSNHEQADITAKPSSLDELESNVIHRNTVLSRLYQRLLVPKPSSAPAATRGMVGQEASLPFSVSYLTGLHMEVIKTPRGMPAEKIKDLLLQDPYVEGVWSDELFQATEDGLRPVKSPSNQTVLLPTSPGPLTAINGPDYLLGQRRRGAREDFNSLPTVQALYDLDDGPTRISSQESTDRSSQQSSKRPNDQYWSDQWAHHNPKHGVRAPQAWQTWTGESSNFVVALIDSGVDLDHPDLRSQYWRNRGETDCFNGIDDDGNGYVDDCIGWDWVDGDNVPQDENGHGSASAGIIAAVPNNGVGIAGLCWGCRIMVLRTLDKDIRGTISGFIKAIDYAVIHGAKVSNNSYGGRGSSYASLQTAVRRARKQGMIFVAAAGNYGSNNDLTHLQPTYPASYNETNIISVAAVDQQGALAPFSCYGKNSVHIAAPGVGILSTNLNKKYLKVDGTSFATPFVTAAAALVWSQDPQLSYEQVIHRILSTARVSPLLKDKIKTRGVLDIASALQYQAPTRNNTDLTLTTCAVSSYLCPEHAECIDTNAGLRCRCGTGFTHQRGSCVADRPCLLGTHEGCGQNEMCERVDSTSTRCTCQPGFLRTSGIGKCEDIDECVIDPRICPRDSKCLNLPGAFDCQCPTGYKWNGLPWIQKGARCDPDRRDVIRRRYTRGR